jgi:hypothetical protein
MSERTCRFVLTALLLVCSAAAADVGVRLPRTDDSDSLPASFSGTSLLQYRMRRLVGQLRIEDPISCGYTNPGGGQFFETMERGYTEWNVSGIPDSAIIDSVFCASNCFYLPTEIQSVELYDMTNRPSITLDPVVLFDDAGDGALYGAYPDPGIGWRGQRLGDAARSDLQNSLLFDWFAIGYTGIGNITNWSVKYNGFRTDSAPRLIVYYSVGAQPDHDVGCRKLIAPFAFVDSGTTVTPACTVYNYGIQAEDYTVRMRIAGVYDEAVPVTGHQPGTAQYVTFPDWLAGTRGRFAVTCTTELAGDGNPANDARRGMVDVTVHDVATTAVASPADTIRAGNVMPIALVRNAGTLREPLTVFFSIFDTLPVYAESIALLGGLPFMDTTVRFPVWNAQEGNYVARCSVYLAGDQVPGNDATFRPFVVTPTPPFRDVGCLMVLAPTGQIDSGTNVTPACSVYNYGNQPEDYNVRMIIGGVYEQSAAVTAHQPGTALAVSFADWLPPGRGSYFVTCSTEMAGDTVPANNTRFANVEVMVHDGRVTAIVAPVDTIPMGPVSPKATVRNDGTQREPARVFFAIDDAGAAYRDSLVLPGGLPYADTTLTFRSWDAVEGEYATRCSLFMAGDQVAANNVRSGAFTVSGQMPGWYAKAPMPLLPAGKPPKDGAWLAYNAGNELIYAAKGNKKPDFYSYFPGPDSWHTLTPWPLGLEGKPPSKGSAGCTDGNGLIYATKGNNKQGFWKYFVTGDSWQQKKDVPLGLSNKKVKGGTDLAYAFRRDTGNAYLLKGYKNEFYRYHPVGDSWHALQPAPVGANAKWDKGSWLAYDPDHNRLYAHKAKYHEFYYYDIGGDSWSGAKRAMPIPGSAGSKKSKDGGCGAWYSGSIYALKGGNTFEFWRYDIAGDSWRELSSIPVGLDKKKVKAGADVTPTEKALYLMKGNKSVELWMFSPGAFLPEARRHDGVEAERLTTGDWRLAISPNPLVAGFVHLAVGGTSLSRPALVRLYDAAGRCIGVWRPLLRNGAADLDVRHVAAGVYIVRVEADGFTAAQKLVVQR